MLNVGRPITSTSTLRVVVIAADKPVIVYTRPANVVALLHLKLVIRYIKLHKHINLSRSQQNLPPKNVEPDTSATRHFVTKTLRYHKIGAEVSGHFGTGTEVSIRHQST